MRCLIHHGVHKLAPQGFLPCPPSRQWVPAENFPPSRCPTRRWYPPTSPPNSRVLRNPSWLPSACLRYTRRVRRRLVRRTRWCKQTRSPTKPCSSWYERWTWVSVRQMRLLADPLTAFTKWGHWTGALEQSARSQPVKSPTRKGLNTNFKYCVTVAVYSSFNRF